MNETEVMKAACALARCAFTEWTDDDILVVTVLTERGLVEHHVTQEVLQELERREYVALSDDAPGPLFAGRIVIQDRCRHWVKRWMKKNKIDPL